MTSLGGTEPAAAGNSLSPRQERVASRLLVQIGPGPAAFFRDACGLMLERPPRRSVTHLVAHLLRDVESAVRSVLEPADAAAGVKSDRHRAKIRAILDDLSVSHDDAVAMFWVGLAGEENSQSLAARAHRSALDAPRPFNDEFLDFVDKVEQVLDAVLDRFETSYFEVFERLDELLATADPVADDARKLRQNFPNSQAILHYFFSRATAAWIEPLRDAGFFASPPPTQIDEDGGTVQFPPWPESQYLTQVAAQVPDSVVETALAIPSTDNIRVNHDLVEIAAALSPDDSARLVPKVIDALGSRFGVLIPQRVGALLVQLCRGGYVEQAMSLASALLNRLPAGHGPAISTDVYAYAVILREHLPALVAAAGAPALALMSGLLDEVIRADAERHRGTPGQDHSPLWRPNIEGYETQSERDLRHALVNAVRDAATSVVDSNPSSIAEVVAELESHVWLIFRRLAFYLLSRNSDEACDLVAARLTDSAAISDWGLEREYLLLAHNGAACLDASHRRRLLTLIDAGPTPVPSHTATLAGAEPESPDPMVRERVARWQRDRLAAVQLVLPPEWDARYQALVVEHGEAPDPATPVPEPLAVWSFVEPVTAGELAAMPTDALVEFLGTWRPPTTSWPPLSPASLRGALSTAVQGDAARRSADASSFIGLPAVYIGAVINGLWQASTNGAVLDWDGVLRLSAWINQQAQDELAAGAAAPTFREWRQPRIDMLRLVMAGLDAEPSPISSDHDVEIWSIIEVCSHDPDPAPEPEAEPTSGEPGEFISLAHDAVRAQAIRAAISYGLRLRRRSPDSDFSDVHALLEQHLDRWLDPSLAVRSIYGELFPNLVWMDADWASRHTKHIFPDDAGQRMLLDAAWDAYLGGGRLTDEAWTLLADTYTTMVDRLDPTTQNGAEDFRTTHTGCHLINRLWNGKLDVDSHDGLLRRFYSKASPDVALQLMWLIGDGLGHLQAPEPALIVRLVAFWDFRVAAVKNGANANELAGFGRWFASGHFDLAWSLTQLLTTLSLTPQIEAEVAVLSRLASLADGRVQPCLAVLERLVSVSQHSWRLTQSVDSIRQVLTVGVSGNPTAVMTSKKVISLLARDHGIDLRDVLGTDTSG